MKNIFESSEVFEAYARIDLAMYGLNQLQAELSKASKPINSMIDKACGVDKEAEIKSDAIDLLKQIITDKKFIDADYSKEMQYLKAIT